MIDSLINHRPFRRVEYNFFLFGFSSKFKPADHNDLLVHVSEAAAADGKELPETVQNIMHTYMLQTGYPLVRVSAVQDNDDTIYVSQVNYLNH